MENEVKKFMLYLPPALHAEIRLQARKAGVTMNTYISTIVAKYILLNKGSYGRKDKRSDQQTGGDAR